MSLTKASYSMISGAPFNVLDYGASPSASAATNATAIQAAIDAANTAGGGMVFLPTGSYSIGTTSLFLKNKVFLVGEYGVKTGNDALAVTEATTTISYTGANAAVYFGNGVLAGVSGAGLVNLQLYGGAAGAVGLYMEGSAGSACVGNYFENVLIANFTSHGVHIVDGVFVTDFERVAVRGCGASGWYLQEETNDTTLFNCESNNNTQHGYLIGDGAGVSAGAIRLDSCRAEGNTGYGIKFNNPVFQASVTDVYLEANAAGGINSESTATTLTLSIRGGAINTTNAAGYNIQLGAGCIADIEGVWFTGTVVNDIYLQNNAQTYYVRIGPCRHGSTASGGAIVDNSAASSQNYIYNTSADIQSIKGRFRIPSLEITDGVTAPSASLGFAKIYIDSADGDLKIVFGDGTVKTIATDT
jgi:hypothetical protein